ncbi:retrovirus-related pol polyprotein from transposon TNT 1-94 [Tanacetum coccineum]|uniref:Retrovirus-related pol polyprotein from transposon TNT 1-94 n=1 Tax=Tanacetum coccineum TaxID=301880 RepID=A0ABQ5JBP5_9ASTR
MAPKRRATTTTTTIPVTNAQLKALIDQGIVDALAACDADRSRNGDDSHNSGMGSRRTEQTILENQVKFATCTLHGVALTWWKSHVKTVGQDAAHGMPWNTLTKIMTAKRMFPEESDKIKKYVGGLPDMIHGSVMPSKPKTMQDAIEFATELMDKKISTFTERQQGVTIAYTAGPGEKKEYAGTLLLCNKSRAATNNQINLTCYECGNQGHYRSDCSELKNQNHGNQAGGTGARGMIAAEANLGYYFKHIREPLAGITTRSRFRDSEAASAHECLYINFLSKIEPKKLTEALEEEGLNGSRKTRWMKKTLLEAIRIFLAYAAYMGFVVYHMDVKNAFLNGKILEEVYVQQPPEFESSEFTNYVCKLEKAMYGLKQAPIAWYQANPKESHLVAVKRIFRYLKAEAEYVVAAGCCAQVLWIKSQLANYDVLYDKVPIFCDNTSAIAISNNSVLHSRTKHIDIRYHFIRDHILKCDIELHFIPTDLQLAAIFNKPLAEPRFTRLVAELGMLNIEKHVSDKKKGFK